MDHDHFDRFVRGLAAGVSRRSVLRRAAGSAIASPAALLGFGAVASGQGNKNKKKKKDRNGNSGDAEQRVEFASGCWDVGAPCVVNEECCGGLECHPSARVCVPRAVSIPTGANPTESQTVLTNNQVCAGDQCVQTNQQAVGGPIAQTTIAGNTELLGRPPTYWVDVDCQFDAPAYRTICTGKGRGEKGAPVVRKITLPTSEICAFVISEETKPEERRREVIRREEAGGGEANAGTGGVANADASGGTVTIGDVRGDNDIAVDASGGTASADASGGDNNVAIAGGGRVVEEVVEQVVEPSTLTLTLEGHVVPGKATTYWLDTDVGRRPATGPALVQVADETVDVGAIVVEARACQAPQAQPGYDWFGQCTAPAADMPFSLYAGNGGTTPIATGITNAQGRARFGNLTPGTYELRPDETIWCYAESDRVDSTGKVTVEARAESHVWSFTCAAPAGS